MYAYIHDMDVVIECLIPIMVDVSGMSKIMNSMLSASEVSASIYILILLRFSHVRVPTHSICFTYFSLSISVRCFYLLIEAVSRAINSQIKALFDRIRNDFYLLRDSKDKEILEKYAEHGRKFSTIYVCESRQERFKLLFYM